MRSKVDGDLVASTLDHYRNRVDYTVDKTPEPYQRIKKRLEKVMANNQKVLMDVKDAYNVQSIVVELESVQDRWAMGTSICYYNGEEVKVPYTVHYSDIYCKTMNLKLIVEGENPIDSRYP